jgi:hypothetical protein
MKLILLYCYVIAVILANYGTHGKPLLDDKDMSNNERNKIVDSYNTLLQYLLENVTSDSITQAEHNERPIVINKKRNFKMRVYYDVKVQNDGSVLLIPKDVNRGHYFIG